MGFPGAGARGANETEGREAARMGFPGAGTTRRANETEGREAARMGFPGD